LKPFLVLCLGNEILSDDSFGFKIEQILKREYDVGDNTEIVFSPLAGFNLLDLLKGRQRVLIIDTIVTGKAEPGTLHFLRMGHFTPAKNLTCSHQISLPTALNLGRELAIDMPDDIDILAVEAKDIETLDENMTHTVEEAVSGAIIRIMEWIGSNNEEARHHEYGEQKSPVA